jgi:hypothetical protein
MDCSVKMGKVRIADELGGKLRPSEKGNSFSTAIKYKLIRFLLLECSTHQGGALGILDGSSGGLHRRRASSVRARVLGDFR